MKHDRAYDMICNEIIKPAMEKETDYVGVEVELPVIPFDGHADLKETGCRLLQKLIEEEGFHEVLTGTDGCLVRVENEDRDAVSFDYHYGMIEFSMGKSLSLTKIAERFYRLLYSAEDFYGQHGFGLTGMGSNLTNRYPMYAYTNDPFYRMIRAYVSEQSTYHDPGRYFTNMHSTQTHIDLKKDHFFACYNLFNALDFVRGMLFSNSVPVEGTLPEGMEFPEGILCARDYIWEHCELPNTGTVDQTFGGMEEMAEYMEGLKLFVEIKDGKLTYREPVTLREYFQEEGHTAEALNCYRSFQNVVLNGYHVLEVRGDCTQPLTETFAPCAFNLGIAVCCEEAEQILKKFKEKNQITAANSTLRRMAVCQQEIAEGKEMQELLCSLIDTAEKGLKNRGRGEEQYLAGLKERAHSLASPGKRIRELQKEGVPDEEIFWLYGTQRKAKK